jgi:hypothetical protein
LEKLRVENSELKKQIYKESEVDKTGIFSPRELTINSSRNGNPNDLSLFSCFSSITSPKMVDESFTITFKKGK